MATQKKKLTDSLLDRACGSYVVSTHATQKKKLADPLLERAIAIMELVARSGRSVSVAEIVQQLKIPKPTAHRICARLERMAVLARDMNMKGLSIGPRMSLLALNTMLASLEQGPRRAVLRSVVEETGETCSLTMLDGDELVFLDRVESDSPLQVQLSAGSRVPLHCTSAGKLLLAMLPRLKRSKLIRSAPLKRWTEETITDPERLERELDQIREERIGRDNEEFLPGLVAVAVPVFDQRGRICAAVSVNAPRARLSLEKMEHHIYVLRRAAEALSATMTEFNQVARPASVRPHRTRPNKLSNNETKNASS